MRIHPRTYVAAACAAACTVALAAVLGSAPSAFAAPGAASLGHSGSGSAMGPGWDTTWAASPQAPTPLLPNPGNAGFSNQTVRNIVFTSVGGNQIRIRLSNAFGKRTLTVGRVSVGIPLTGAQLVPGTTHPVTFGGQASVTIPVGAEVVSDPVPLKVSPLEQLAVSVYLPTATGRATYHFTAQQTGYIASGDQASATASTAYTTTDTSWYFLDGVLAHNTAAAGTVVAFGDSITDGFQSQTGANARWPNFLARRLDAAMGAQAPAVADEGISGNRVLHNSPCFGINALARFQRDVLSQPGVKDVIVMEGINDIGFSATPNTGCSVPNTSVTAAQIEAGYRQLISLAHANGLKIFGATLTPFKGAGYWSPAGEAKREAVNNWIRTSHAFDGVIDFAKAVQDRFNPLYINPAYNSGDNLHPNDAGYEAMANAINLALLSS
jgi:lysophospholipase L1-like esterase